ncbi:MAG TPA: hypothetical protein VG900_11170 [Hyphomicrobiaceae bacterium]|jgi:hypothetical protein|nr:hypothetical protein [Hyphomicrobiaceae bacterium]
MRASDLLLVEAAYSAIAVEDVDLALSSFADNVGFTVHAPPGTTTYIGEGHRRELLSARMKAFYRAHTVLEYAPETFLKRNGWIVARVRYRYQHRVARLEIDGTMRHYWRLNGDRIVHFEIVHDVQRMAAYFDLSAARLRLDKA